MEVLCTLIEAQLTSKIAKSTTMQQAMTVGVMQMHLGTAQISSMIYSRKSC